MRNRQQNFPFVEPQKAGAFGGSLLKNSHAKGRRPFSSKRAMHVVMRSSLAKGEFSLRASAYKEKIRRVVYEQAKRANVRIYRYANRGNHLHLLLLSLSPKGLARFLRAASGLIARLVMKSEKGRPLPKGMAFWDQRPFSRIVSWGKEYAGVARYLLQNTLEALGFLPYQPRGRQRAGPWAV